MNYLYFFKKSLSLILNFIFPTEKISEKNIRKILENRLIFQPKNFAIHFFPYQNILINKAITSLKFRNNVKVAKFFGEILYENLPEILMDLEIKNNFFQPVIITVPISRKRKMKRGYNQSDLIIKHFMKLGGFNFCQWQKNNLIKIKDTKPQTIIHSRQDRIKNPLGSFKLKYPQKIENQNIILFDDVYTTGSTIKEAQKILNKAHPKKILIMTLAR